MGAHGHAKADARNLHLHRVALDKLRANPELVQPVIELVDQWLSVEGGHPSRLWLSQWRQMLTTWPIERLAERVLDDEEGQVLRQCSPLAPVLTPQERWAALDEVNGRLAAGGPGDATLAE